MSATIVPSLLAANIGCLGEELARLQKYGIEALHVDVMDGTFVPNIAFGPNQVQMLREYWTGELDVHLMVLDPDRFISPFVEAGADSITIHAEASRHLHRSVQLVKSFHKKVGVALNPATTVETLKHIIQSLDRVLVMTVNPGFGGQQFIPEMIDKLAELKELRRQRNAICRIQVDGGVGMNNIAQFIQAGAQELVIGSALFARGQTEERVKNFQSFMREESL